jgi:hypothetical protein
LHWYFDVLELAFKLALAGASVALPYVTWCATNHAVKEEAIQESLAFARNERERSMWENEPSYVTEDEAIRAHALKDKGPDDE